MPLGSGLEYSIDGLTFQSSQLFTNVNPGTYQVYVRDKNGCSASSTVTLDAITTLTLTGWQGCVEDRQEKNYILEVIPMETAVDSATMQWIWKNAEGAVIHEGESRFNVTDYVNKSGIKDSEFPLRFTVTVSNKSGCEQEINFTVESIFCSIPKGISPNNDGYNDNFNLIGLNVSRLVIYNRNGTEVYSKNDYRNEWYGQTHNGNDLPTGTYFYVITPVAGKSQAGWIYLTREIQ
jgi:gliding motility-associated-like protein